MKQSNIGFLRDYTKQKSKKKKHEFSKFARFFPYTANDSRATFDQGLERVLGEVVRRISAVELSKSYSVDEISNNLQEKIVFESEELEPSFREIIKSFIGTGERGVRIFHPYTYHYIPLSENGEALKEKELAEFVVNIFFKEIDARKYFSKSKANNVFIQLLLDSMGDLKAKSYEELYKPDHERGLDTEPYRKAFKCKLPFLADLFKKDFEYLVTRKDGYIEDLPLIVSYYYFMYVSQLSVKLRQGFAADYTLLTPLYWILDHESLSKSRLANEDGYKQVTSANRELMANVVLLAHLNILYGEDFSRTLVEFSNTLNNDEKEWMAKEIYTWTIEYTNSFDDETDSLVNIDFTKNAIQLRKKLIKNIPDGAQRKFPKPIDVIGAKYFLKSRGLYGLTLNLSQDLLLLLVGVSIRGERTLLKDLFAELECRGLYLDRYSKDEVKLILDRLNLLDKKSDSGDAQYVKPIF